MSTKSFTSFVFTCAALTALVAGPVLAADPAIKCESGKLKESSKYSACRLKADSKAVKKGEAADYSRCEAKFSGKWTKIEDKAGAMVCPTEGDATSMDARITTDAAEIATLLKGNTVAACGDGVIDAGEDCDFGAPGCLDLNGNGDCDFGEPSVDCDTATSSAAPYGELSCDPATCLFDTSDCSADRYEDTGLGTVIDHQTGLEWQKSDDAGGLTDKDNYYTWTADGPGGTAANGTAFGVFLEGLNGGTTSFYSDPTTPGYAGHHDWRLPLIEELITIVDLSLAVNGDPAIDQSVFGPLGSTSPYLWSSSDGDPGFAWHVYFIFGTAFPSIKHGATGIRAVRGGS